MPARYMRMKGFNVMFPMGFDAFRKPWPKTPRSRTRSTPKCGPYKNIENMRAQFKTMGAMFDWRREMISADPEYCRWTQWFFLKFFHGGLAYTASTRLSTGARAATQRLHGNRSGARTGI